MTRRSLLEAARIEREITLRAKEFDVGPLIALLRSLEYRREDMSFESNPEPVSSGTLVEAVSFRRRPHRSVTVTLNLGLIGSSTLLPSYFFDIAEQSPNPEAFYDFIRFFDHRLLENFLSAVYPETDLAMYKDWEQVKMFYFKMLGLGSIASLQHFFQLYFPELRVQVSRHAFRTSTAIHAVRTGVSRLDGTAVIGRTYESDSAGFRVEIYAVEETDERGRAWPHVVRDRLVKTLLPLLAPFRLPLVVSLTVLLHASWARIQRSGYLGYERVFDDAGESGHRILIYRGDTGSPEPEHEFPPEQAREP